MRSAARKASAMMVGIDDGRLGIIAHAAGTEKMDTELLLVDGKSPFLLGAGGGEKLMGAFGQPMRELEIVGMILVGHAQGWQTPRVLHIRVEVEPVVLHRQ